MAGTLLGAVDQASDQYNFATGLFNTGRFRLAAQAYRTFLEKYPNHPKVGSAQFFLAQSLFELKDYQKALAAYRIVVERYPTEKHIAEARYRVGECLVLLRRYGEAADAFRRYLGAHPKHPLREYALYLLGESLLRQRDYQGAAEACRKQLAEWPKSTLRARCLLNLGECCYALKDYKGSAEAYQGALAAEGWKGRGEAGTLVQSALLGLGLARFELGRFEEARQAFAQLLDSAPTSALADQARFNLALYRLGRFGEADSTLAPLGQKRTELADDALYWQAMARVRDKRPAQAVPLLLKASELPDSNLAPEATFQLVDVHLTLGKHQQAVDYAENFLRRFPNHPLADQALYDLVYSLYTLKRFSAARQRAEEFLKRFPKSALAEEVKFLLGHALVGLKEYKLAAATFADLAKDTTGKRYNEACFNLARAYYLAKDWSRALEAVDRMRGVREGTDYLSATRFIAGECAFALGNYQRAVEEFTRFLQTDPQNMGPRVIDIEEAENG